MDEGAEGFISGVSLKNSLQAWSDLCAATDVSQLTKGESTRLAEMAAKFYNGNSETRNEVPPLQGIEKAAPAETETAGPKRVGEVTVIQNPYGGETPVQDYRQNPAIIVRDEASERAAALFAKAEEEAKSGVNFKTALSKVYNYFKGPKGVAVRGMTFKGQDYLVDVPNSLPKKLASRGNTAEVFAVLEELESIIADGKYVGSGTAMAREGRPKDNIIRYDYFESRAVINGQEYVVKWDVEIIPGNNKYKTHQLAEVDIAKTGTVPAPLDWPATSLATSTSEGSLSQPGDNVKPAEVPPLQEVNGAEAQVRELMERGSRSAVNTIIQSPELRAAYEGITGEHLSGSNSQMRRQIEARLRGSTEEVPPLQAVPAQETTEVPPLQAVTTEEVNNDREGSPEGTDEQVREPLQRVDAPIEERGDGGEDLTGAAAAPEGSGSADGDRRLDGESASEQGGEGSEAAAQGEAQPGAGEETAGALRPVEFKGGVYKAEAGDNSDFGKMAAALKEAGARNVYGFIGKTLVDGKERNVSGYISPEGDVYIRVGVPNTRKIALHEYYHLRWRNNPDMQAEARRAVRETYTAAELDEMIRKYGEIYESLYGQYDIDGNLLNGEEVEDRIYEEICADAYAFRRDGYRAGVEKVTGRVRQIEAEYRNGQKNNAPGEGTRYSIDPELPNDLQRVLDGTFPSRTSEVHIGTTSDFLHDVIGLEVKEVLMPPRKAYAAMVTAQEAAQDKRYDPDMNYHGLGIDGLVRALEASENPVAAFSAIPDTDSGEKRSDRIVLVTDQIKNGNNVVVIMKINTDGRWNGERITADKTITIYDRAAISLDIEKAVAEKRLLYIDKKRSQASRGRNGSNSQTGLLGSDDFKSSIHNFLADVNWKNSGNSEITAETTQETVPEWKRKLQEYGAGRFSVEEEAPTVYGSEGVTYGDGETEIPFTYAVMDAADMIASHDINGIVNEAYPSEFQPRDRSRAQSTLQINNMARKLNPALLGESPTAQNGAPMVRADGVVIGGNARSIAIVQAYAKGWAGNYAEYISKNAERFGLDASSLPQNPVLVRVLPQDADYAALGEQLNSRTNAGYSATERAMQDARNMGDVLPLLKIGESGDLNSRENGGFIKAFMNKVVDEGDRAELTDSGGKLNQAGLARAERAVFAYAYGDTQLLTRLSEDLNGEGRNIVKALMAAAPKVAVAKTAVQNGSAYNIPVADAIVEAVRFYDDARQYSRQNGYKVSVREYADAASLFTKPGAESIFIAEVLEGNARGFKNNAEFLDALCDSLLDLGDPDQINFFGEEVHDLAEIVRNAKSVYEERTGRKLREFEGYNGAGDTVRQGAENTQLGTDSPGPAEVSEGQGEVERTPAESAQHIPVLTDERAKGIKEATEKREALQLPKPETEEKDLSLRKPEISTEDEPLALKKPESVRTERSLALRKPGQEELNEALAEFEREDARARQEAEAEEMSSALDEWDREREQSEAEAAQEEIMERLMEQTPPPEREAIPELDEGDYQDGDETKQRKAEDFINTKVKAAPKLRFRDKVRKIMEETRRALINSAEIFERLDKEVNAYLHAESGEQPARAEKDTKWMQYLGTRTYKQFNMARSSTAAAVSWITDGARDTNGNIVGKSINDILGEVRKDDALYSKFQEYLFLEHHADRMSIEDPDALTAAQQAIYRIDKQARREWEARKAQADDSVGYKNSSAYYAGHKSIADMNETELATEALYGGPYAQEAAEKLELLREVNRLEKLKNKPIFGWELSAAEARAKAAEILKEHEEFGDMAKDVYDYFGNLMQYRVDKGLVTQEFADAQRQKYPHYVPTNRAFDKSAKSTVPDSTTVVGRTVKKATGGDSPLLPLHYTMADQTMKTVRAAAKNELGQGLLDVWRMTQTEEEDTLGRNVREYNAAEAGKIGKNSSEEERYRLLKDAQITPAEVRPENIGERLDGLNELQKGEAKKAFGEIANKLKLNDIDLENSSLEFPFRMSNRSVRVSAEHQTEYGGSYEDFAKVLSCLSETVKGAVLVETHEDYKAGTGKANADLKQVYVLVGAARDGDSVIPVQMEVKEYYRNTGGLYLTVAMEAIKTSEVIKTPPAGTLRDTAGVASLFSEAGISVAKLFEKVKSNDGRLLKWKSLSPVLIVICCLRQRDIFPVEKRYGSLPHQRYYIRLRNCRRQYHLPQPNIAAKQYNSP